MHIAMGRDQCGRKCADTPERASCMQCGGMRWDEMGWNGMGWDVNGQGARWTAEGHNT